MFSNMYARSVMVFTAIFQMCELLLLSSVHFLALLDYKEPSQQRGSILELSSEDKSQFRTLQNANKQLAALKHSGKQGGNSDHED